MAKEITAEKTGYIYYTQTEGVPDGPTIIYESRGVTWAIRLGAYQESLPIVKPFLRNNPDVRLVLIPSFFRPGVADIHYLFWNDTSNLAALDTRVITNTYTDADFQNSIKTMYELALCDVCNHEWPALAIDTGDPYIGAPGLLQEKLQRHSNLRCPKCGSWFRLFVVKLFL